MVLSAKLDDVVGDGRMIERGMRTSNENEGSKYYGPLNIAILYSISLFLQGEIDTSLLSTQPET